MCRHPLRTNSRAPAQPVRPAVTMALSQAGQQLVANDQACGCILGQLQGPCHSRHLESKAGGIHLQSAKHSCTTVPQTPQCLHVGTWSSPGRC
jgi:hypothetical protein